MKSPFELIGFDHVRCVVGNAKQATHYYQSVFGFELVAFSGLETGNRENVSYVLRQDKTVFVLDSPLGSESWMNDELRQHGDGVKDIAFEVDDAAAAWKHTTSKGAKSAMKPKTIEDDNGKVALSAIHTYGDTIHTFVERQNYRGAFLPGYEPAQSWIDVKPVGLHCIDHIVGNQPDGEMEKVATFYEDVFGFHRLWTVDDKDISTNHTALRSIVVESENTRVKMPINEPAEGLKKSQIQEYIDFYAGAGVQHVALSTHDAISTVQKLVDNRCDFLYVPDDYYDTLTDRVGEVDEDISALRKLGILVDRDEDGYLLQLFTKPVQDRPTLFYEVIQRKGAKSFGKGNFKALFEAIEREQERRGTL